MRGGSSYASYRNRFSIGLTRYGARRCEIFRSRRRISDFGLSKFTGLRKKGRELRCSPPWGHQSGCVGRGGDRAGPFQATGLPRGHFPELVCAKAYLNAASSMRLRPNFRHRSIKMARRAKDQIKRDRHTWPSAMPGARRHQGLAWLPLRGATKTKSMNETVATAEHPKPKASESLYRSRPSLMPRALVNSIVSTCDVSARGRRRPDPWLSGRQPPEEFPGWPYLETDFGHRRLCKSMRPRTGLPKIEPAGGRWGPSQR